MTTIKQAVVTAMEFVAEMYPDANDIRLEEVEFIDNLEEWLVTVSFPPEQERTFANAISGQQRLFKTIRINAHNGEPLSLKVFTQ